MPVCHAAPCFGEPQGEVKGRGTWAARAGLGEKMILEQSFLDRASVGREGAKGKGDGQPWRG